MGNETDNLDEHNAMHRELSSGDCVRIDASGEVSFCSERMGKIGEDFSEAFCLALVHRRIVNRELRLNIYRINEQGNVFLLDSGGKIVKAWVSVDIPQVLALKERRGCFRVPDMEA